MTTDKQPLIISFEGNIGSGKSSIFKYVQHNCDTIFSKELKICFIPEPKNVILSIVDYYDLSYQMKAYISRIYRIKDAIDKNYDIIFTERSMLSDKKVFGGYTPISWESSGGFIVDEGKSFLFSVRDDKSVTKLDYNTGYEVYHDDDRLMNFYYGFSIHSKIEGFCCIDDNYKKPM